MSKQAPAVLPMRAVLGAAPLPFPDLLLPPAHPVIVWDADEFTRYALRKRARRED